MGTHAGSTPTKVDSKTKAEHKFEYPQGMNFRDGRLRDLIVFGYWDHIYSIIKFDKDSITEKINGDGSTVLHIAVGIGQNDFIKNILSHIRDIDLTEMKNLDGSTVLHIAAIVGNTNAAELLVHADRKLLHTCDNNGHTPLDRAYENMHLDTIACLLEAVEKGTDVDETNQQVVEVVLPPIERGVDLLANVISAKQYSK